MDKIDKKWIKNYRFSFDPFCGEGTWSNGRAAAEGLEFGVNDLAVGVNFNLQLMDIKSFICLTNLKGLNPMPIVKEEFNFVILKLT